MSSSRTVIVYSFHPREFYYTGWCCSQTDPMHPERLAVPSNCTEIVPPVGASYQIPVFDPDKKEWILENRTKFKLPVIKNKIFRITCDDSVNRISMKSTCIDSRLFTNPSTTAKLVSKLAQDIQTPNCYYVNPCPVIFDIYSRLTILNQKIISYFNFFKLLFGGKRTAYTNEEFSCLNIQFEEIVHNIKRILDQIVCLYYLKHDSSISKEEIFNLEVDSLGCLKDNGSSSKKNKGKSDKDKSLVIEDIKNSILYGKYEPFFDLVNTLHNYFKHHITYDSTDINITEHHFVYCICDKNDLESVCFLFVKAEDLVIALNSFLLEFCFVENNNLHFSLESF